MDGLKNQNSGGNANGEAGVFLAVDEKIGGVHSVRHQLWLRDDIFQKAAAAAGDNENDRNDPDILGKIRTLGLAKLKSLGAYQRNALAGADGSLMPLPPKDKRDGITIDRIVPCIQRQSLKTGLWFAKKYSDHYVDHDDHNLDDPLPGVAADQVLSDEKPQHREYIAHFKNGRRQSPDILIDGVKHHIAGEQAYDRNTGRPLWLQDWDGGFVTSYVGLDGEGRPRQIATRTGDDNLPFIERHLDSAGNITMAFRASRDGGRRIQIPPEQTENLPVVKIPEFDR